MARRSHLVGSHQAGFSSGAGRSAGFPESQGQGPEKGEGWPSGSAASASDREASVGLALDGCRVRCCSVHRPPPPFCGIGHRLARPCSLRTQPWSAHQKCEQVSPVGDLRAPGPGSPCHACRGSEAGRCLLQRVILSQCGIFIYCHLYFPDSPTGEILAWHVEIVLFDL